MPGGARHSVVLDCKLAAGGLTLSFAMYLVFTYFLYFTFMFSTMVILLCYLSLFDAVSFLGWVLFCVCYCVYLPM